MSTEETDPIDDLTKSIKAATASGKTIIGHFGAVPVEGKLRTWMSVRYDSAVPRLLTNPEYKIAQILSVLGSEVRLAILRLLLEAPKTASEVMAELSLRTTGQAYHHLKELERAGYIEQISGGQYRFNLEVGQVYLAALALAADAGAESPEPTG
ncbi:MAG: winged helix-turn-helix domain-containing protein [Armatimonas sp.]